MMAEQGNFFDLEAGQAAKEEALERFESESQAWLAQARQIAREVCRRKGTATSDDVLTATGLPEGLHHNVVGAIFRRGFVRVGFTQTARPEGHARVIGVWEIGE